MPNDSKQFLQNNAISELVEIDRFIALMWWKLNMGIEDHLSLSAMAQEMIDAGFSKPNISRLSKRLLVNKNISTKDKGKLCRLSHRFSTQLDAKYLPLVKSDMRKRPVARDLREAASKISDSKVKSFLEECVSAYEYDMTRSAIVMSWLAAVAVLHETVVRNHLKEFNEEAKIRLGSKNPPINWKYAKTTDDLSAISESDLLEVLVKISVLGKPVKAELKACLDRRNTSGHPNSAVYDKNTSAHHIEILINNVFKVFET